jgi:hypothetical protein
MTVIMPGMNYFDDISEIKNEQGLVIGKERRVGGTVIRIGLVSVEGEISSLFSVLFKGKPDPMRIVCRDLGFAKESFVLIEQGIWLVEGKNLENSSILAMTSPGDVLQLILQQKEVEYYGCHHTHYSMEFSNLTLKDVIKDNKSSYKDGRVLLA